MCEPAQEQQPYCRILEQPASRARFRYECEGRFAGSILGATSTLERKTFPQIEVVGHKGRGIVVVSCVTKDHNRPQPHPHNLVGRYHCENGVCYIKLGAHSKDVGGGRHVVTFKHLGIQCVKRRDIEAALKLREEKKVDPFQTGFSHKNQPQSIDLNAVRLCFQVFLPVERNGRIKYEGLRPVVSDVISKNAMSNLVISRLSQCSAPQTGGTIILFCEKVALEDIAVTFTESSPDGTVVWRADAQVLYEHKQVAIGVRTPTYPQPEETRHVEVFIQLRRLSDNQTSEPVPFTLLPASADRGYFEKLQGKRIKIHPADNQQGERDNRQSPAQPSVYVPQPEDHRYQLCAMQDNLQGSLTAPVPGPSGLSPYHGGDITWGQNMSPLGPAVSPNMGQAPHVSPNITYVPHMSPNMAHVPHLSPNMGCSYGSSNISQGSPNMGDIPPNLGYDSPNSGQQQATTQLQQTATEYPTSSDPLLIYPTSDDISDWAGMLDNNAELLTDALSDTLIQLSSEDLLNSKF